MIGQPEHELSAQVLFQIQQHLEPARVVQQHVGQIHPQVGDPRPNDRIPFWHAWNG